MNSIQFLFVLVCSGALATGPLRAAESEATGQHNAPKHAAQISFQIAKEVGIQSTSAGAGTLERVVATYGRLVPDPDGITQIRARFPGQVTNVRARLGDDVKAGDALATIESSDSLQPYTVESPLDGTVIQRNVNVGELADAQILFTVARLDPLWVELKIFPGQRRDIANGQTVHIDTGHSQHEARIRHIVPSSDNSPFVIARAEIENARGLLSPGVLVSARIVVERIDAPLVIESRALQSLDDSRVVFVRKGDVFEVRPVELGLTDGRLTEVLSGLIPDERYVVDNSYLIKADIQKSSAEAAH
ncbi:efflux RND transporter periplasmic adaptor subunit [Congregibacter brevis]|uniref:Efflux RND transporter periplasmic adaptor subunit n=1 Tax=Congregibacter brevis TaxID=3081201 RepID=A0ABZ0IJC2_9GAMM|nr:efflux RND transporter periplasmic adaptor subunit [Congregibacter sp. IMCC45268]